MKHNEKHGDNGKRFFFLKVLFLRCLKVQGIFVFMMINSFTATSNCQLSFTITSLS